MKLTDLEPTFLRYENRGDQHIYHHRVETVAEAHGVLFLCPKCFLANGGAKGTHAILCWSRSAGTPETAKPLPGRWALAGTSFEDLTLNGDVGGNENRSVLLLSGCNAHFHVTSGEILFTE